MKALRRTLVVVAVLLAASFASGCLKSFAAEEEEDPTTTSDGSPTDRIGGTGLPNPTGGADDPDEDVRDSKSERWHFHNYWGNDPNLTLFEGWVPMDEAPDAACCPPRAWAGRATFGPEGTLIVPPETGRLDVVVTWNATPGMEAANLTYRPTGAKEFVAHGTVENGVNATLEVTEEMTDPPHASGSDWRFRVTPVAPAGVPVGAPPDAVHVTLVASIGRPIYIDPPHVDRWNGSRVLPVASWTGALEAAKGPGERYVVHADGDVVTREGALAFVAPSAGAQVPEGTQAVLARLTWETDQPANVAPSLALGYEERHEGTSGAPEPTDAAPGLREYRIPVTPGKTDNPYTNHTGWSFQIFLEGDVTTFEGTVTLEVWATREAPDTATFPQ